MWPEMRMCTSGIARMAGSDDGADGADHGLRRAERIVQGLRWLTVVSWIFLVPGAGTVERPPVAIALGIASLAYVGFCEWIVRKERQIGIVAMITTFSDTLFITAMSAASGGLASPVLPVFDLAVLATTIRFGMAEGFLIATLASLAAVGLFVCIGGGGPFQLAEFVFYIYFTALLGGLLSSETRRARRRALEERERAAFVLALNRHVVDGTDLSRTLPAMLQELQSVARIRAVCAIVQGDGGASHIAAAGALAPPSREEAAALLEGSEPRRLGGFRETGAAPDLGPWIAAARTESVLAVKIPGAPALGVVVLAGEDLGSMRASATVELADATAAEIAVAVEKARLHAELVDAQAQSRRLLHRVIDAEEAERRRIAGELHDRMGKRFFEFYYDVRLLQGMSVDRDSASSEVFARIIASARECAGEIRTLMNDLRPSVLDDFGFLEALKEFATALVARGELELSLEIDESSPSAGPEADLMLFRVLQEAVFNARKHAAAKRVEVAFGPTEERKLRLVVRDDGAGFDIGSSGPGHYGLLYMRERAEACGADFLVRSAPRRGTEIEVRVAIPS